MFGIPVIVEYFENRDNIKHRVAVVPYEDVVDEGYNLSVGTYVEAEDTREVINIDVLNAEIKTIVERENVLRAEIDKIIAEIEVENE